MIKETMNTTTNLFILLIMTLLIIPATAIRYVHAQPVPQENNNTGDSTSNGGLPPPVTSTGVPENTTTPSGLPPPPPPATTANPPTSSDTTCPGGFAHYANGDCPFVVCRGGILPEANGDCPYNEGYNGNKPTILHRCAMNSVCDSEETPPATTSGSDSDKCDERDSIIIHYSDRGDCR